jgi:hypothetical protein
LFEYKIIKKNIIHLKMGGNNSKPVALNTDRECKVYGNCTICDKSIYYIRQPKSDTSTTYYLVETQGDPSFNFEETRNTVPSPIYFTHNPDGLSVDIYSAQSGNVLLQQVKVWALKKDENTGKETSTSVKLMPNFGYKAGYPMHGMVLGRRTLIYGNIRGLRPLNGNSGSSLYSQNNLFLGVQKPLSIETRVEPVRGIDKARHFIAEDSENLDGTFVTIKREARIFPLDTLQYEDTYFLRKRFAIGSEARPATSPDFWAGFPGSGNYRTNSVEAFYFPEGTPPDPQQVYLFMLLKMNKTDDGLISGIFINRQDPPVFEGEYGNGGKLVWPPLKVYGNPGIYPDGNLVGTVDAVPDVQAGYDIELTGDFIKNLAGSYIIINTNLVRYPLCYMEVYKTELKIIS